jgi:hypothetical protein
MFKLTINHYLIIIQVESLVHVKNLGVPNILPLVFYVGPILFSPMIFSVQYIIFDGVSFIIGFTIS